MNVFVITVVMVMLLKDFEPHGIIQYLLQYRIVLMAVCFLL
jgi:hypothetical protein